MIIAQIFKYRMFINLKVTRLNFHAMVQRPKMFFKKEIGIMKFSQIVVKLENIIVFLLR